MSQKMPKKIPKIDDNVIRQAEELAGYGLSLPQIAAVLGLGERTLHTKKGEHPEFAAALERGRAKAAGIVGKALFLKAKDGDVAAIRWWEMTRQGRSEKVQTDSRHEVTTDADTEARLARLMGEVIQRTTPRNLEGDNA